MAESSAPTVEKVGWIGLGDIGAPMATRLIGQPGGFVVCDIAPEATKPFAEAGADVAADPAGVVAAGATLISVMVRTDAQVRDVVGQMLAASPEAESPNDRVVAIHSTIEPGTAEELAHLAGPAGVEIVDAPVSGGAMGAATGRIAVLAGGDAAAVDRCRAAFAPFADLVVHFGPIGAGTRAKIARNLITYASYAAAGEASRLAEAAGLDLVQLGNVVRHSDAVTGGPGAVMIRGETAPISVGDGLRPPFEHARSLGEKDLALAVSMAEHLGLDAPIARLVKDLLPAALGVPHREGT